MLDSGCRANALVVELCFWELAVGSKWRGNFFIVWRFCSWYNPTNLLYWSVVVVGAEIESVPSFFKWLKVQNMVGTDQILRTNDGFCMVAASVSTMLMARGIDTLPDSEGNSLECRAFFDDWFLFAVPDKETYVYGLLKMREQEDDQKKGIHADGDTPGVTISFIAFDTDLMRICLENPTAANGQKLGVEINRVVAYRKQNHHPALKAYFIRPQAEAAYLIAQVYVKYIASFGKNGVLQVPEAYRDIYLKKDRSPKYARVPDFLEHNNRSANRVVCDHQNIFIENTGELSEFEELAILATHTGNVSLHSFAAEVRYHAMFLTDLAKIRLPIAGSPYASAIRADMSIGDKEFQGPTPYYHLSGKFVMEQVKYHPNKHNTD